MHPVWGGFVLFLELHTLAKWPIFVHLPHSIPFAGHSRREWRVSLPQFQHPFNWLSSFGCLPDGLSFADWWIFAFLRFTFLVWQFGQRLNCFRFASLQISCLLRSSLCYT
jgi:hypothetical protein